MTLCTTLLLGAFGLATPAFASPPLQVNEPVAGADFSREDLSRSCRRIVHLERGRTWTGVARQVDGTWQLKQKKGWLGIPKNQVLRAPKEVEVLREFKQRRKQTNTNARHQLQLARWCAGEGLRKEALLQLDRILDLHPHDKATLGFISECDFIFTLSLGSNPTERVVAMERLLQFAQEASASFKERSIAELAKLEDQSALHSQLMAGLNSTNSRRRAFCAQSLGRLFPGQEAKRLLRHAILDKSEGVRRSASEALGAAGRADLIVPVVRALESANPEVRVRASTALGYMGYPEAVEPLISYMAAAAVSSEDNHVATGYIFTGTQRAFVQDFDVEVATNQAVADPQINALIQGSVLQAGVAASTEYAFANTSRYAKRSLSRLTGQITGMSASSWGNWFKKNGPEWAKRTTITHGVRGD